ncbi:MAG: YncE family protein [Methylovulum sp.]|nr:YncE family protein [Methylovulum sp.]
MLTITNSSIAAPTLPQVSGLVQIGSGVFVTAINDVADEIYAPHANSSTAQLYIIDGATKKVKETIDLGGAVNGVAYNKKTDQLIVSYIVNGTVAVIDRKTKAFVGAPVAIGYHPAALSVDESTNTAYISNMHSGTVSVFDITNNKVIDNIVIGTGGPTPAGCNPWDSNNPCTTLGSSPGDSVINQKTHKLYVISYTEKSVTVINTLTNKIEGSRIPTGHVPNAIAVNEKTNRIYVDNWQEGTVSVIDGKTRAVITKVLVGSGLQTPEGCYEAGKLDACESWGSMPIGITVNEKENLIYVSNSNDGTVSVINGKTNKEIGKPVAVTSGELIPGGCENFGACTRGSAPHDIHYNPNTGKLYVVSLGDGWLTILDAHGKAVCTPMEDMPDMCM